MFTAIIMYLALGSEVAIPGVLTIEVTNKIIFVDEKACFDGVKTIVNSDQFTLLENCRPVVKADIERIN